MWQCTCGLTLNSPSCNLPIHPSSAPTPQSRPKAVLREVIPVPSSSETDDSENCAQRRAARRLSKLIQVLMKYKINKKKRITKVALYVEKDKKVSADFDKTITLDLLNFFVERKQIVPEFVKAAYDIRQKESSQSHAKCPRFPVYYAGVEASLFPYSLERPGERHSMFRASFNGIPPTSSLCHVSHGVSHRREA